VSEEITPKKVVELAVALSSGNRRVGYTLAAYHLGIRTDTARKISNGGDLIANGNSIPVEHLNKIFELFRQQRMAQIREELAEYERDGIVVS